MGLFLGGSHGTMLPASNKTSLRSWSNYCHIAVSSAAISFPQAEVCPNILYNSIEVWGSWRLLREGWH